jgi:hypothetical protein
MLYANNFKNLPTINVNVVKFKVAPMFSAPKQLVRAPPYDVLGRSTGAHQGLERRLRGWCYYVRSFLQPFIPEEICPANVQLYSQYCGHTNRLRKCRLKKLRICIGGSSKLDFCTLANLMKFLVQFLAKDCGSADMHAVVQTLL